jgi:P-type conjugative transfer protein TrbG
LSGNGSRLSSGLRPSGACLAALLLIGTATAAPAADPPVRVPALDPAAVKTASAAPEYRLPPPLSPLGPNPHLGLQERRALALAHRWRRRPIFPHPGPDGVVRWPYGSTEAKVVCSPNEECGILLKPGEIATGVTLGDKADWVATPQMEGLPNDPSRVTVIEVRPFDAGPNLTTDLSILTSEHRHYQIRLIAVRHGGIPYTGWTYADDMVSAWQRYQDQMTGDPPGTPASAGNIYFPYTIDGADPSWRPLRVWSNGEKTFILFAPGFQHSQGGAPVLEAITGGCGLCIFRSLPTAVLNTRWDGNYMIYDGVLDHGALMAGNQAVRIDRVGAP